MDRTGKLGVQGREDEHVPRLTLLADLAHHQCYTGSMRMMMIQHASQYGIPSVSMSTAYFSKPNQEHI